MPSRRTPLQVLGCHLMEGLVDVNNHRRRLAQGDASREVMLGEVQAVVFAQCMKIQRGLYDGWKL